VIKVIIALGQIEKALARSLRNTKESGISPAPLLSPDWLKAANTDSPEFRLALALASTWGKYGEERILLRQHLEPVELKGKWNWAENPSNDVVWHEGDFVDVLNAIFARRVMKAIQTGSEGLLDESSHPARLDDLAAFIEGRTDDDLIADLVWGLSLIDWPRPKGRPDDETPLDDRAAPSSLYALLRLCFRPKHGEEKFVPAVAAIHRHAAQGNGTRASAIAARRLFASGYEPAVDKIPVADERLARRTAAALLFPIAPALFLPTDPKHYSYLQKSILRTRETTQP
jgi:CRISPR-associated protein Csx17